MNITIAQLNWLEDLLLLYGRKMYFNNLPQGGSIGYVFKMKGASTD